jgi:hypothetical protein
VPQVGCYWRGWSSGLGVAIIVGSLVWMSSPSGHAVSPPPMLLLLLLRRRRREGHGMGRVAHTFVDEWAAWEPRWSDRVMVIAALLLAENAAGPTTCQAIETSCTSQIAAGLARIWPSRCCRRGSLLHLKPRPPICDQR